MFLKSVPKYHSIPVLPAQISCFVLFFFHWLSIQMRSNLFFKIWKNPKWHMWMLTLFDLLQTNSAMYGKIDFTTILIYNLMTQHLGVVLSSYCHDKVSSAICPCGYFFQIKLISKYWVIDYYGSCPQTRKTCVSVCVCVCISY